MAITSSVGYIRLRESLVPVATRRAKLKAMVGSPTAIATMSGLVSSYRLERFADVTA